MTDHETVEVSRRTLTILKSYANVRETDPEDEFVVEAIRDANDTLDHHSGLVQVGDEVADP